MLCDNWIFAMQQRHVFLSHKLKAWELSNNMGKNLDSEERLLTNQLSKKTALFVIDQNTLNCINLYVLLNKTDQRPFSGS